MLCPHYTLSTEDDESCAGLECDLFPSQRTTLGDRIGPVEPGDVHEDIVLEQYLRLPSLSPPPGPSKDNAVSELSGVALIKTECYPRGDHEEPFKEPPGKLSRVEYRSPSPEHATEKHEVGYHEAIGTLNYSPPIRLQVNQPQVMLRLKLSATSQAGKEKKKEMRRTKSRETQREKGRMKTKNEKTRKRKR